MKVHSRRSDASFTSVPAHRFDALMLLATLSFPLLSIRSRGSRLIDCDRLIVAARERVSVLSRVAASEAARESASDEVGADALDVDRVGFIASSGSLLVFLGTFGRGFVIPSRTYLDRMAMSGSGTW